MLRIDHHRRRLRDVGFAFCLMVATLTGGPGIVIAEQLADLYSQAARSFNARDYQAARDQLHDVLAQSASRDGKTNDAQHELLSEATFFMAESLVGLGDYSSAIPYYSDYLKKYGPGQRFGRQAMYRRGECAYFVKDGQRAVEWLDAFHGQYPHDVLLAHALPYLGDLALESGDHAKAARHYQRALDQFPKGQLASECRFGLTRCAEATGDIATARQQYLQRMAAVDERLRDLAGLHLGLLEYNVGDFAAAERALAGAIRDHPDSRYVTVIHYWHGLSQLALGAYSEAAASLDSVAAKTGEALAPGATYYSGEALRMLGQFASARERYRNVRTVWPDSQWSDDSLRGEAAIALAARRWDELATVYEGFESEYRSSPHYSAVRRDYVRGMLRQRKFRPVIALLGPLYESQVLSGQGVGSDRATAEEGYLLAAAYFGDRQYEKVLKVAESAASTPGGAKLASSLDLLRASSSIGLERFAAAEAPLRRYLKNHDEGPGAARCRGHLAVALAHQEKFTAAAEMYEEYVTRHPDHSARLRTTQHLASAAHSAGRRDLARQWYEILVRPDSPSAFRKVGREGLDWCQLELSDRSEESRAIYRKYLDRPVEDRLRPEALLSLAESDEEAGQFAAAVDVLARFLADYPNHPRHADALYKKAWCLVELDRWNDAKTLFTQLQQDRDGSYWADATYRLAQRAAAEQDFTDCERWIDQLLGASTGPAVELKPHALLLLGQVAAAQSDWPEVRVRMRQLADQYPQFSQRPIAEFWIAESYYREEDWDAALVALQQVAANGVTTTEKAVTKAADESWLGMVPLRKAQIHAHRELWHEAKQIARTILHDYPQFAQRYEVNYLLGRCAMADAEYDEARNLLGSVADSSEGADSETAAMAEWMIGETYLHQNDFERALRQYLRVEIHSQFPRWQAGGLLQAGKCYEAMNDPQSAIEVYARLIERFPDTQFRVDAQRRLEQVAQTGSRQ